MGLKSYAAALQFTLVLQVCATMLERGRGATQQELAAIGNVVGTALFVILLGGSFPFPVVVTKTLRL